MKSIYKKIAVVLFAIFVMTSVIGIVSACQKQKANESSYAVISVGSKETNKSISLLSENNESAKINKDYDQLANFELMLDTKATVIAINGLDSDAEIMLAGENFIGLNVKEVSAKLMLLAKNTGFFKANVNLTGVENVFEVNIGAGSEKDYSVIKSQIDSSIKKENKTLSINVNANIQINSDVDKLLKEKIKKANPNLSDSELENISFTDLTNAAKIVILEKSNLVDKQLEEAYYSAKEYKFRLAQQEDINKLIATVNSEYKQLLKEYDEAIADVQEAIDAVKKAREKFNQKVNNVREKLDNAYIKLLKAQAELNKKFENASEEEKEMLASAFKVVESAFNIAKNSFELGVNSANLILDSSITALVKAKEGLVELYKELPQDIQSKLQQNVVNLDSALNKAKDDAFDSFEKENGAKIKEVKDKYMKMKNELLAVNK